MVAPTPKLEKQNGRWTFAEGGKTRMLGKGDRTTTATPDAAGTQTSGQTTTKSRDNLPRAKGGRRIDEGWGLALPAQPGMCAPARPDRRR
jgi:hypothetical protein